MMGLFRMVDGWLNLNLVDHPANKEVTEMEMACMDPGAIAGPRVLYEPCSNGYCPISSILCPT